jgi:hypothetical protein
VGDEPGLADVQSFEAELMLEILEEGYLGETANRFDDIFNGVSGNAELHIETSDYFRFTQRVQDRAQRRTAASGKFVVKANFDFANGTRARLNFEDVFFEGLPVTVGARKDYVKVKVSWKCSNVRRIL